MPKRLSKHLQITGRVQGVGYRAGFQSRARQLQLSGWVRNRLDGSVEANISGEPAAIALMIEWAWQGPSHALVHAVAVSEADELHPSSSGFSMLPTR